MTGDDENQNTAQQQFAGSSLGWRHAVKLVTLGVAIILLSAAAIWAVFLSPQSVPDQQSLSLSPPTGYVGVKKCAECHEGVAEAHAAGGHAHTFAAVADSGLPEQLNQHSWLDPEREYAFEYEQRGKELPVRIPEKHGSMELPLEFAFGSGHHSTGFVTLIDDPVRGDTVGLEHRGLLTTHKNDLMIAPGHSGVQSRTSAEDFGMLREPDDTRACFDCHTTAFAASKGKVIHLMPNVQCEKCHGPGLSHVELMENGTGVESSDFHRRFDGVNEEITLCGRCHRLPKFVEPDEITTTNLNIVRFQPVGLMQSACFKQSKGTMKCSTCHNPHETASATSSQQHNSTCRSCHADAEQTLCPISPETNCVTCHMPEVEVMDGMTMNDHWIRVHSPDDSAKSPSDQKTFSTGPH